MGPRVVGRSLWRGRFCVSSMVRLMGKYWWGTRAVGQRGQSCAVRVLLQGRESCAGGQPPSCPRFRGVMRARCGLLPPPVSLTTKIPGRVGSCCGRVELHEPRRRRRHDRRDPLHVHRHEQRSADPVRHRGSHGGPHGHGVRGHRRPGGALHRAWGRRGTREVPFERVAPGGKPHVHGDGRRVPGRGELGAIGRGQRLSCEWRASRSCLRGERLVRNRPVDPSR